MREVMFRASVDAARYANRSIFLTLEPTPDEPALQQQHTANWTQRVAFRGAQPRTVYRTDWGFVFGAAAASALGVLGVLPLFWGWWQLGRAVSLNPLEVAHAFCAPLLRGATHRNRRGGPDDNGLEDSSLDDSGGGGMRRRVTVNSNSNRAQLARAYGQMRVRYGAVVQRDDEARYEDEDGTGDGAATWPTAATGLTAAAKPTLCFAFDGDGSEHQQQQQQQQQQRRRVVMKPASGTVFA
jgi:hypothetical protein